jgi:hypothetical protein
VGGRRGFKGAGSLDLTSTAWRNNIKIRGALALQLTEAEVQADVAIGSRCFLHAINHQVFLDEMKSTTTDMVHQKCERGCGRGNSCLVCSATIGVKIAEKEKKASTWEGYSNRLNWTGVSFPAGKEEYALFSKLNPDFCLSVYRTFGEGEIYLDYRSNTGERRKQDMKKLHIIMTSRLESETMEIESHFLPVTKLSHLSAKILEYNHSGKKSRSYLDGSACVFCTRHFVWPKKWQNKSGKVAAINAAKASLEGNGVDNRSSTAFLVSLPTSNIMIFLFSGSHR